MRGWLTVLAWLALCAPASAATDAQISDAAWPGSPCSSVGTTVLWAPLPTGEIAAATGAVNDGAGGLVTVRCEITIDPVKWAKLTPVRKCDTRVHEFGHLAGKVHVAVGVMMPTVGEWPPCAERLTWHEREIEAVRERLLTMPSRWGWSVGCSARFCRATEDGVRTRVVRWAMRRAGLSARMRRVMV